MLKKLIKYTDYDGNEREEEFWFNLSKADLARLEFSKEGGLEAVVKRLTNKLSGPEIYKIFEEIILGAYGEKSDDGRRFVKSPELSKAFSETPAYDELLIEILQSEETAAAFINGILPEDVKQAEKPGPPQ